MRSWFKESKIEKVMKDWVQSEGYKLHPSTRRKNHKGIDIEAQHKKRRRYWFIEVKGWPIEKKSAPAQRHMWFINALGQIITRMTQKNGKYGIALPDKEYYKNKILNLPREARKRIKVTFFLANKEGVIQKLTPNARKFRVIKNEDK